MSCSEDTLTDAEKTWKLQLSLSTSNLIHKWDFLDLGYKNHWLVKIFF